MFAAMASAAHASTARPARAPALVPVDGGANYYARFSHGLPTSRSYFPIGVWGSYDHTQAHIDQDKAVGYNLYVWDADTPSAGELSRLAANKMKALFTSDWYGSSGLSTASANAGYLLEDEADGRFGLPEGFTVMQQQNAAAPNDGRIRYANYTKNVLIWYSDADAARFVNDFQQVVSSDFYWFTDPYQVPTMEAPDWLPEAGQTITTPQIRRAANYGYQIDRMRQLDALDGKRQPIWGFVEEGWPFTQTAADGARAITPPEMRAAVWQSIIAGARGIVYFNHSFGGPCLTQNIDRDPCYRAIQAELTRTNSQITQLAPVLNSPTVSSGWSQGAGTTAMVKWVTVKKASGKRCKSKKKCKKAKGKKAAWKRCKSKKKCKKAKVHLYVFAGSAGSSVDGRFSLPCVDDAKAAVVGEHRTVPVRNGSFRDHFVDGNAIHIYRVDARSRCRPPRRGTVTPVALPRGDGPAGPSRINVFRVIIAALFIAMLASFRIGSRPRGAPWRSGKRARRAHHLRMR
jgi:hypothetical protein